MRRWLVTGAFVGSSLWYSACGVDTRSIDQNAQVFLDATTTGSSGSAGSGSGSGSSGSGSNGSGSNGSGSDGSGSGSNGSGAGTDAGVGGAGDDAGLGGHHGNGANNDQTNFYTCASCGAGGAGNLGSGMLMIAGVALVLRRRRRS